jgi:tRNA G10  N-methylase Trm11
MQTVLSLTRRLSRELPAKLARDDVRFSETLVEHFLELFTMPGDYVIDPFAGYGTTLDVAERMGRVAFGIELDPARVEYARSYLRAPSQMIHGDARRLLDLNLPRFRFSLTSPPYMTKSNHPQDPLAAYSRDGTGYRGYLRGLRDIYAQLREVLLPSAVVVVEVSNIKADEEVTPLAWDVASELSALFRYSGEVIVAWNTPSFGYDHSYCLTFEHSS